MIRQMLPRPLLSCFVVLLSVLGLARHSVQAADSPPHIVVFLSDDHTWSDSDVYGSTEILTPNMSRLAQSGMTFDQAYVASPSCAPSRAALLTGLYPARNGAEANHARPRPEIKKLPAYLKELGYEVVSFGKVGHYAQTPEYGFDLARHFNYHEDIAIPQAAAWLRERKDDRPLCMFVGTNWPHVPWPGAVDADLEGLVQIPPHHVATPATRKARLSYLQAVRNMDRDLGEILDTATAVLGKNLCVLQTSDHGAQWPGAKWTLNDEGLKTPLIVSWPGQIAANVRTNALVSWIDILPTLVEIAGGTPPQDIDGKSFLHVLRSPQSDHRQQIFASHTGDGDMNVYPSRAVKTRDGWKYIRNLHPEFRFTSHVTRDSSYWRSWLAQARNHEAAHNRVLSYLYHPAEELYYCPDDRLELQNLISAPQYAAQAESMRKLMDEWLNATKDQQLVLGVPQFQTPHEPPQFAEGAAAFQHAAPRQRPTGSLPADEFVNPIAEGADPWVMRNPVQPGYLWCFSAGNRGISIHQSDDLSDIGAARLVWRAPETGPVSREIWAPELHYLQNRWYIYFAASDGKNENHLAYVLESASEDPFGPYELHGPLATGDGPEGRSPNIWAIDMTVFEHDGRLYAIWSGWDAPGTDRQYLYIAPMNSPVEIGGPRVRVCDNADHLWERIEADVTKRGLNEAPQVVHHEGKMMVTYSCAASWLSSYRLGLLQLVGTDPLSPGAWKKSERPVFTGNLHTYGVGHSCFVMSPNDQEWWHVFHAKRSREPGWQRAVFIQPMNFLPDGTPNLGDPLATGTILKRPAGESPAPNVDTYCSDLHGDTLPEEWNYYGHHQLFEPTPAGITIGHQRTKLVNGYRCGEKIVLRRTLPQNLTAKVTIDFAGMQTARDAGILFRTTGPSVGYDAQRGYFAALIPRDGIAVVGKMDGQNWKELARCDVPLDVNQPQQLQVRVIEDQIIVTHNDQQVLSVRDQTYTTGTVGLRVVDSQATFSQLEIGPIQSK